MSKSGGKSGSKPSKSASNPPSKGAVKKKEDAPFDLEQQFILRLPPGPALALHHDIQSGSMTLKDKLSIDIQPDQRHGKVIYGGDVINARLVDLPCIVESIKTTDKKTFYKTADVCQMLIASYEDEGPEPEQEETESPKKAKDKEKKYHFNHGLTPPLKNVRKRRFRKVLKKKNVEEWPDIEKEVKRLFRTDNEAVDVKWEIVTDDDKSLMDGTAHGAGPSNDSSATNSPRILHQKEKKHVHHKMPIAEHDIFGEVSSSDEDEKEINVMDSEEDNSRLMSQLNVSGRSSVMTPSGDPEDSTAQAEFMSPGQSESSKLLEKLLDLKHQLEEIKERRRQQEEEINTMDDPDLKEGFQEVLEEIIQEEISKQKEYDILSSMLKS